MSHPRINTHNQRQQFWYNWRTGCDTITPWGSPTTLLYVVRQSGCEVVQGTSCQLPQRTVPVSQLCLHHVVNQWLGILSVLSYIGTEVEVRICATAYCKVVNISEDVYSVGKCSLSTNILLKGCLQKIT
jgi:hypothetical protein